MTTLTNKLRALLPKPDELPAGYTSDLYREALVCLDTMKGSVLRKRLSEIGPLIWQNSKNDLDLALWQAVECFYFQSMTSFEKGQKTLMHTRFSGAVNSLRKWQK